MNCKAGDLAIIVKIPQWWLEMVSPEVRRRVLGVAGTVVRCVSLSSETNIYGMPCWNIEEPLSLGMYLVHSIEDCVLMPIRGGDKVVEQTEEMEVV